LFGNIGIRYLVVWDKHISKIVKKYKLENGVKEWIEASIKNHKTVDMRGKNNPRYGTTSSDETKLKIGKKTAERASDKKYTDRLSKSIRAFYNTPDGMKRREIISAQRKEESKLFWEGKDITDPIKVSNCIICGDVFEYRIVSDIDRKTCKKNGCTNRYNNLIGKPRKPLPKNSSINSYKTKMLKYGVLLELYNIKEITDINNIIIERKNKTEAVPKTFGITKKSIEKYFSSINNYLTEIKSYGKIA